MQVLRIAISQTEQIGFESSFYVPENMKLSWFGTQEETCGKIIDCSKRLNILWNNLAIHVQNCLHVYILIHQDYFSSYETGRTADGAKT